jgi:HEAT repeat protein
MPTRVYIAVAVLLVAITGVVGRQLLRSREPVYQGKRLSGWLMQYMANHWVAGQNSELDKQAQSAIQQIGTNAIPALLRMLRAKDSALKANIMGLVARRRIIKIPFMSARSWNWAATAGFEVLGAKAQSAVPALVRITNLNISPTSKASAIRALGSIGPPAKEAVPSLLQWTTDANYDVRFSSIYALAQIGAEPERVVPVLIRALKEPDIDVQTKAVSALEHFGLDAKPAVPALLELLSRPFVMVDRTLVTNALKAIDLDAAAKAGVK